MARKPIRIADVLGFGGSPKRDLTKGYQREVRSIPRGQKYQGSITRARPTAAQELAQLLTPNTRGGAEFADRLTPALENIPLLGGLLSLVDARRQYNAGNAGQAAGLGILAALGAVPGGAGAKAAKEAAETAAERGIIAYHGSPYSFDRFDIGKIGTGEGAQAYGHGLYFAESEDVARSYRDALARPYYKLKTGESAAEKFGDDTISAFDAVGGDPEEVKQTIKRLRDIVQRDLNDFGVSSVSELKPIYEGDLASQTISHARRADNLEALLKSGELELADTGSMYKVRVDARPEEFVDWDKPFSGQPKNIQDAISYAFGPQPPDAKFGGFSMDKPNAMHTRLMKEKGVKGIKYLDQVSRDVGEGSRNYVVFDDALIDILKKYGIAIPAIAGGGLLATQPQQDGGL